MVSTNMEHTGDLRSEVSFKASSTSCFPYKWSHCLNYFNGPLCTRLFQAMGTFGFTQLVKMIVKQGEGAFTGDMRETGIIDLLCVE